MIAWSLFLFALACLMFCVAIFLWLGLRFGALVLSMEVGILREFKGTSAKVHPVGQPHVNPEVLSNYPKSSFEATDGMFVQQDEDTQFVQEQVENLRKGNAGLTEEELDQFVRQAVADKV